MSTYMTETEQLEEIKKWWLRHQTWITPLLVIILVTITGYRYWNWHVEKTLVQASITYQNMINATSENKPENTQSFANLLIKDYPKTVYAASAHLALSKLFVENNNLDKAQAELEAVVTNSKNEALRQIANLRLSRILIAKKEYDKAFNQLTLLDNSPYLALANELRGDIYSEQGRFAEAEKSYNLAKKDTKSASTAMQTFLEMKSNAVAAAAQSKTA